MSGFSAISVQYYWLLVEKYRTHCLEKKKIGLSEKNNFFFLGSCGRFAKEQLLNYSPNVRKHRHQV